MKKIFVSRLFTKAFKEGLKQYCNLSIHHRINAKGHAKTNIIEVVTDVYIYLLEDRFNYHSWKFTSPFVIWKDVMKNVI